MHIIRTVVYAAFVLSLASCASQTSEDSSNVSGEPAIETLPKTIEGRWSSTQGPYGGAFELDNMDQQVRFATSSCPGDHPFTVRKASGSKVVLVGKLGNPCGNVKIELSKNQKGKWNGTYEADLPDKGRISQE